MKLYDFPRCPYCQKVRLALAEKGLEYDRVLVDLIKREQKEGDFIKMNPYGKVPVLVDGETVLYESSVINEYLEEKYPDPPLMPSEPASKARTRMLCYFADNHFNTPWFNIYRELLLKNNGDRDTGLIETSKAELSQYMERLDRELEGKQYLLGAYTLADIALTPRIALFDILGIAVDAALASAISWMGRIKNRESYAALEIQT